MTMREWIRKLLDECAGDAHLAHAEGVKRLRSDSSLDDLKEPFWLSGFNAEFGVILRESNKAIRSDVPAGFGASAVALRHGRALWMDFYVGKVRLAEATKSDIQAHVKQRDEALKDERQTLDWLSRVAELLPTASSVVKDELTESDLVRCRRAKKFAATAKDVASPIERVPALQSA